MDGIGGVTQWWTLSTACLEAEATDQRPNWREQRVYKLRG